MNTYRESKRFVLRLFGLAVAVLLCLSTWAAAGGPVADFPGFIPFAVQKTGDVAVDKIGNVYVNVTLGTSVYIRKFNPDGDFSGDTYIGTGTAYGLAVDANGDIYAAITGPYRGVYRVDHHGIVLRLPGTEHIFWANALAFDPRGNLYVTESSSDSVGALGGIWRIPPKGDAERLLQHELLTGTGALQGPANPIGANGIAYFHGNLYVVNTDKALIVQVPIRPDGSLGQPEVWNQLKEVTGSPLAGSPFPLAGDGMALDVHGNVYVAMVTRLAVVKINAEDLSQETIAVLGSDPKLTFALLDMPNSLGFGTGKGERQSLFITNLGTMKNYIPTLSWPGPGLVKIEAGVPGLPLP